MVLLSFSVHHFKMSQFGFDRLGEMEGADFNITGYNREAKGFIRPGTGKVFFIGGHLIEAGGIKGEEVVPINRNALR